MRVTVCVTLLNIHIFALSSSQSVIHATLHRAATTIASANMSEQMLSKKFETIGTHSGMFHCDEATAIGMLRLLDNFKDARVIRSRDEEMLHTLDILVDVGSVYDPENFKFDHHQRNFTKCFSDEHNIRLSSAGLVYLHFGKEIIKSIFNKLSLAPPSEDTVELIHNKVYNSFVKAMDAIDNGVNQYPSDVAPKYSISTDLGSRVERLNPSWNESMTDEEIYARFERAIKMCQEEFVDAVEGCIKHWLPARELCVKAFEKRFESNDFDANPTGEYVVFEEYLPWKGQYFDLLAKEPEGIDPIKSLNNLKFVVYPGSGQWRYLAVPAAKNSFESKLPFPEEWRGLRGEALEKVCGVAGAAFVHHSGFTGGNATLEGVIKMILKVLNK